MPSTYSNRLKVTKQGTGDNSGTWGTVANDQTFELLDEAIAGVASINCTTGIDYTLSVANGATSESRKMVLKLAGTPTANINIIVPSVEKTYDIDGSGLLGSFTVTIKASTGTGVSFSAGQRGRVYFNGTNVISLTGISNITGDNNITVTQVGSAITLAFGVSGLISAFAGSTAPAGWLMCNGQAVNRTTYSSLFSVIGTTYGTGDGSTTFNLPDLRGRVIAGLDNMGGVSAANRLTSGLSGIAAILGTAGGDERFQQHNHTITDPGHKHLLFKGGSSQGTNVSNGNTGTLTTVSDGYNNSWASYYAMALALNSTAQADTGSSSTSTTGITLADAGAGASQNVQPTMVLNYIIKV